VEDAPVSTRSSSSTPDPNASQTASPSASATRIWLGCSGWAYPTWKPEFYPPKTSPKKMLEHYATQLNSVEVPKVRYQEKDAQKLARELASRRFDKPSPLYYAQRTSAVPSQHAPGGTGSKRAFAKAGAGSFNLLQLCTSVVISH
jgi:hypothetical protein